MPIGQSDSSMIARSPLGPMLSMPRAIKRQPLHFPPSHSTCSRFTHLGSPHLATSLIPSLWLSPNFTGLLLVSPLVPWHSRGTRSGAGTLLAWTRLPGLGLYRRGIRRHGREYPGALVVSKIYGTRAMQAGTRAHLKKAP